MHFLKAPRLASAKANRGAFKKCILLVPNLDPAFLKAPRLASAKANRGAFGNAFYWYQI